MDATKTTKNIFLKLLDGVKSIRGTKPTPPNEPPTKSTDISSTGRGQSRVLYTHSFNGEKNFGEIGPIKSYLPDYGALRARSWQAYLESEIAQIAINRFVTWVIGEGLKLQSEPEQKVLAAAGINVDRNKFSEIVEAYYSIYADSRYADHARMSTKNELAREALKNALIGGDVLVVLRMEETGPTIQLIDGFHVRYPYGGNEISAPILKNGNRIEHGIELSPSNEHIAYYVAKRGYTNEYERIPARAEESGLLMAFMVYGLRYRLDNHRGLPLLSVVLETIKKLERYKEATVGSAEERQKIAYFIEHGIASSEIDPNIQQLARLHGDDPDKNPVDDFGNEMAAKITATTNKQAFNLGLDQTIKALESKNELYFKDFYTVNMDIVYACVGIPPNVAMGKYDDNFSASRAAIQDWAHTLKVTRKLFSNAFEKPVYSFWMHMAIFQGAIQAAGFLKAFLQGSWMIIESYLRARFVGTNVPHIDPLKEVEAVRLKLGDTGASLPLTTLEAATEELGGGGSDENMEQYAKELEESKKLGIEVPVPEIAAPVKGKD